MRAAVAGRALALVGVGAVLGLGVNAVHPRGVRFSSFSVPLACSQTAGEQGSGPGRAPDVALLSPTEVAGLCADPTALVADARPADRFAEGHVVGAIHLPCTSSQGAATAAVDLLAARKTLVVYGEAHRGRVVGGGRDAAAVARPRRADCRAGGRLCRLEPRRAGLRLRPVRHLRGPGG